MSNEILEEAQVSEFETAHLRKSDLELLLLKKQNKQDLLSLKHIMETYESEVYDIEVVLARIIDHYAKSVPFERKKITSLTQTHLM